jgi:hypothetical protein
MARALEVDYLVIGAGASGMAFADALTDDYLVRDLARGDREIEARALGLRHGCASRVHLEPAAEGPERSLEDAEQGALAASVRPQQCDPLTGLDTEGDVLDRHHPAVPGRQLDRLRERLSQFPGSCIHRRRR